MGFGVGCVFSPHIRPAGDEGDLGLTGLCMTRDVLKTLPAEEGLLGLGTDSKAHTENSFPTSASHQRYMYYFQPSDY